MPLSNAERAYKSVASVAKPTHSEGLKQKRAILLLWFLRHVYGIDDLDAYEYVCDGNKDQGVDGLYLERAEPDDNLDTLVLFQSKYPTKLKNVGVGVIRESIGVAELFQSADALQELLDQGVEPELEALIRRFGLISKLGGNTLRVRTVFVTAGTLTSQARHLVKATNANRGHDYIKAYDVLDLAPMVEAFTTPKTVKGTVEVHCGEGSRFLSAIPGARVAICRVPVSDIVQWPGIDDRSLFDLNVRRELGRNQVRRALDRAIRRTVDHPNFIAYHNGLTVVCRKIDDSNADRLVIHDLSVVNGAQSTIAFKDNEDVVSDDLSVVVKFVEVAPERQLAREVAIRSNTQNPVNARNLRARDGIQLRLVEEFRAQYPHVTYEIRPDATVGAATAHVIQNDDAAQLLTAIFHQRPWLAVKRLSLFNAATYPEVFTPDITASHVYVADLIARRVQERKALFPDEYQRSWRLTALVAAYLVGQLLRTGELPPVLERPEDSLRDEAALTQIIDRLVKFAAGAMKARQDEKRQKEELDDFKVDFKREDALKELAGSARRFYVMISTVQGE